MTEARSLWNRLLDRLDDAGLLTLRFSTETPAEVAKHIQRRTGDDRVLRFVWRYYYPQIFGGEPGTMTDREAGILIESFKKPPIDHAPLVAAPADKKGEKPPLCAYCGENPVAEVERK
jgi:hypothetical protein